MSVFYLFHQHFFLYLLFCLFPFYQIHEPCLIFDTSFLQCQFVLHNSEYSNLLIVAACSNKSASGKTSLKIYTYKG